MKVAAENHVLPIDDRSIERFNAVLAGAFNKVRTTELGIDEAEWMHSCGGHELRHTHVQAGRDKVRYNISVGWPNPAVKRYIQRRARKSAVDASPSQSSRASPRVKTNHQAGADRQRLGSRYLAFGHSQFGASLDMRSLRVSARTILPSQPLQSMIRSRHRRVAWHYLLSGLGSAAPARTL